MTDFDAPYVKLEENEVKGIVYNFATLCSLLENKKLNFQQILIKVLSDENYRNLLKQMLNETRDYYLVETILKLAPEIATAKYISRIAKLYVPSLP